MKLLQGTPEDIKSRLEKEVDTYRLLKKLNIPFMRVDHKPLLTMEACAEVDKILDAFICKNLFLCNSNKSQFFLLMIQGNKKFNCRYIAEQIQSTRLSFAGEEYMQKFLNITPGSVSVMGLMNDLENRVQLLIDKDILKNEYF